MTSHECKHEVDFAIMQRDIGKTVEDTQEILSILRGDNGKGHSTKIALLEQGQRRAWWWLGAVSLLLLGVGVRAIFSG